MNNMKDGILIVTPPLMPPAEGIHVGVLRPLLIADVLRRTLQKKGMNAKWVLTWNVLGIPYAKIDPRKPIEKALQIISEQRKLFEEVGLTPDDEVYDYEAAKIALESIQNMYTRNLLILSSEDVYVCRNCGNIVLRRYVEYIKTSKFSSLYFKSIKLTNNGIECNICNNKMHLIRIKIPLLKVTEELRKDILEIIDKKISFIPVSFTEVFKSILIKTNLYHFMVIKPRPYGIKPPKCIASLLDIFTLFNNEFPWVIEPEFVCASILPYLHARYSKSNIVLVASLRAALIILLRLILIMLSIGKSMSIKVLLHGYLLSEKGDKIKKHDKEHRLRYALRVILNKIKS